MILKPRTRVDYYVTVDRRGINDIDGSYINEIRSPIVCVASPIIIVDRNIWPGAGPTSLFRRVFSDVCDPNARTPRKNSHNITLNESCVYRYAIRVLATVSGNTSGGHPLLLERRLSIHTHTLDRDTRESRHNTLVDACTQPCDSHHTRCEISRVSRKRRRTARSDRGSTSAAMQQRATCFWP